MNDQQLAKLRARAEHFLDLFLALREKYALLRPLAFDPALADRVGRGPQARGHTLLKNVLLESCVQDLVKLTVDAAPRAPNAANIMATLEQEGVRPTLLEEYTVVPPPNLDADAEILAHIVAGDKKRLSDQFDREWSLLNDRWPKLRDREALASFKTWRDTRIAHSDLRHDDGTYRLVDLTAEGLQWSDLGDLISELQAVVDGITILTRSAGFAWGLLDEQVEEASAAFWQLVG